MNDPTDPTGAQRRALLIAAGLATTSPTPLQAAAPAGAVPPSPTGRAGDFDFLNGEWKIDNRRWKDGAWDRFEGEATVRGILGGLASIEELRIPARQFGGMGLRLLDVERRLWADFWVNARNGVLGGEPSWGSFVDGVGRWDSDDQDGDQPIIVRGAWDQITPRSCRWLQATSRDGGRSWQENWVMHWTRA